MSFVAEDMGASLQQEPFPVEENYFHMNRWIKIAIFRLPLDAKTFGSAGGALSWMTQSQPHSRINLMLQEDEERFAWRWFGDNKAGHVA